MQFIYVVVASAAADGMCFSIKVIIIIIRYWRWDNINWSQRVGYYGGMMQLLRWLYYSTIVQYREKCLQPQYHRSSSSLEDSNNQKDKITSGHK